MRPDGRKSKVQRAYDASRRQEQARQQHLATLDHAERLFLERGYVATTVGSIARAAGVSAATIYKTYGGKTGLVRALCDRALSGDGPVPAETRSDDLRASHDARTVVDGWGTLTAEVSPRTSPLLLLLRSAAATDGDAAALYGEFDATRLLRMAENARYLAEGGHLRPDLTAEEARDVMWLCTSPELYELLVLQRGWSTARFGTFVSGVIASVLR